MSAWKMGAERLRHTVAVGADPVAPSPAAQGIGAGILLVVAFGLIGAAELERRYGRAR